MPRCGILASDSTDEGARYIFGSPDTDLIAMVFNDIERKRIERALDVFLETRRPPPHIRPKLYIGYRLAEQSVEIVEIRPQWDDEKIIRQYAVAKATYVRSKNQWKVFWKRADLKWHGYEPHPTAETIDEFLAVVAADECCCSFG